MDKLKIGIAGIGSIAQIAHIPVLLNIENVQLVAVCDIDRAKINSLSRKYDIPNGYSQLDDMLKMEKLDGLHICTPNLYHFSMALFALSKGVNVLVEKPIALHSGDAQKLVDFAAKNNVHLMVGMHNRFREDVVTLRHFMEKEELGEIFYIKTGWLRKWDRSDLKNWNSEKKSSGGGVLIDMGIQLIDLAVFLTNLPKIKKVRLYDYHLNPDLEVEDAALAVIETISGMTITVEISWRMYLEKDTLYTNVFGKEGAAKLNPLRIHKEMHNNLVNVSPLYVGTTADQFKKAYENEIIHFTRVISGDEQNLSSGSDALYVMKILDALYASARHKEEVQLI